MYAYIFKLDILFLLLCHIKLHSFNHQITFKLQNQRICTYHILPSQSSIPIYNIIFQSVLHLQVISALSLPRGSHEQKNFLHIQ